MTSALGAARTLIGGRAREAMPGVEHVVVVGAGLSGLSAAMRLAGAGRRVTVLERGSTPGGRAAVLDLAAPGGGRYRFDPGPTVLTMPDLIDDCFDALGENTGDWLRLHRVDPAYRGRFADGSTLNVYADPEAMRQEIAQVCGPQEAAGFTRFSEAVSRMYRYEMRDFIDRNLDSPLDLLGVNLARLAAMGGFGRLAPYVSRYLKDPRTQRLYSFQALYAGVSPQQALAIYAVISYMDSVAGVFAAEGGMSAVPQAMADAAARHGVEFRYDTDVTRIEHASGRASAAITAAGERIAADAFVVTPDLPIAQRELLGLNRARLGRMRYSPSCFLLLAGASTDPGGLAHHTISFGHAWEETFTDLAQGHLMRDPSLLISVPSLSDPSLAPAQRHAYYVLAPTPNTNAALNWERLRPLYRDQLLRTLAERDLVDLSGGIEVEQITTPQDWLERGMAAGTPFAAAHTFTQTGPFRPANHWGENVTFAGSGTQPGVGVPMVLISGRLAAERILGPDPSYRSRAWR